MTNRTYTVPFDPQNITPGQPFNLFLEGSEAYEGWRSGDVVEITGPEGTTSVKATVTGRDVGTLYSLIATHGYSSVGMVGKPFSIVGFCDQLEAASDNPDALRLNALYSVVLTSGRAPNTPMPIPTPQ